MLATDLSGSRNGERRPPCPVGITDNVLEFRLQFEHPPTVEDAARFLLDGLERVSFTCGVWNSRQAATLVRIPLL
jgi:hypothetical protein